MHVGFTWNLTNYSSWPPCVNEASPLVISGSTRDVLQGLFNRHDDIISPSEQRIGERGFVMGHGLSLRGCTDGGAGDFVGAVALKGLTRVTLMVLKHALKCPKQLRRGCVEGT